MQPNGNMTRNVLSRRAGNSSRQLQQCRRDRLQFYFEIYSSYIWANRSVCAKHAWLVAVCVCMWVASFWVIRYRAWLKLYADPTWLILLTIIDFDISDAAYRAFALISQGPTCWCSRQKSRIKIILNWNTNTAAVTSCANALVSKSYSCYIT
jgi:hypothetical protein